MRLLRAIAIVALLHAVAFAQEKLVYETDSLYHHIIVSDSDAVRILRFHKGPAREALGSDFAQSAILLSDPYSLYMNYTKFSMAGVALTQPGRALFIGLGAGTLPKFFAKAFPNCQVDVAELDGKVVDVAKKYFFLPDLPNLKITVMDGRLFVKQATAKYDLIMLDAYRDEMIPFHLMTKEFLEQARSILTDDGVLISNIAIEKDMQLYPWMVRTYQSVFPTVLEGAVPNTINHVLLCKSKPVKIDRAKFQSDARGLQKRLALPFDLASYAAAFADISTKTPSDRVLTDDYAPVNLMRIRKADEKDWKY